MQKQKSYRFSILISLFLCTLTSGLYAQLDPNQNSSNYLLFEMSLEDLMDIPITTTSRQNVSQRKSSTPVTIITSDDIYYSGAKNIAEVLQFAQGIDMQMIDRQHHVIGVRGFAGRISDRMLALLDGRPLTDPITGTTNWNSIPVLLDDIDHIEIVRGPGGAAWGANAFTGVINIITKKSDQIHGGTFCETVTEYTDNATHLQYGTAKGPWSWKASFGFTRSVDSDAAGQGRFIRTIDSAPAPPSPTVGKNTMGKDWGNYYLFNTDASYLISNDTFIRFGASQTYTQQGDYEFATTLTDRDNRMAESRLYTRMEHTFNQNTTGSFQWFANYSKMSLTTSIDGYSYLTNDVEAQLNFTPAQGHNLSTGTNLRFHHIQSDFDSDALATFGDDDQSWAGIFLIDRWQINKRLALEIQGRLDHSNETTTDWSTRTGALYSLDDEDNHTLRLAFARAFRSPNLYLMQVDAFYGQALYINHLDNLKNEHTYSLETGYSGKLTDNLLINLDSYYQRFENIIGLNIQPGPPPYFTSFENIDGATGFGTESSLTYQNKKGKASIWYSYNRLITDKPHQNLRSFLPAAHKFGITTRLHFADNWTINTNYVGYITRNGNIEHIRHSQLPRYHRLDISLSRTIRDNQGTIMIGIADLLNHSMGPVYDGGSGESVVLPGQTFFTQLQLNF